MVSCVIICVLFLMTMISGEIRTREYTTNKATLDSQDLLMLREKDQQLKAENQRYQSQVEKLSERIKGLQGSEILVLCKIFSRISGQTYRRKSFSDKPGAEDQHSEMQVKSNWLLSLY